MPKHRHVYTDENNKVVVMRQFQTEDEDDVGLEYRKNLKSPSEKSFVGEKDFTQEGTKRRRYLVFGAAVVLVILVAGVVTTLSFSGYFGGDDSGESAVQPGESAVQPGESAVQSPSMQKTMSPKMELEQMLRFRSATGGKEFDDDESYQSKALAWVERNPAPKVRTIPMEDDVGGDRRRNKRHRLQENALQDDEERLFQRFALACLYYATNLVPNAWTDKTFGEGGLSEYMGWAMSDGWLEPGTDECTWSLLICNEDGQVIEINMQGNRLTGQFPHEIAYLKDYLQVLDIAENYFYNVGELPNTFLGELTELRYLYTEENYFIYDGIPTQIGKLTNLLHYDCSYCAYSGSLQESIFEDLKSIEYLSLTGNFFNSTIPRTLAGLPKLKYLYISHADITGDISNFFTISNRLPEIREFWVDKNPELTGSIPTQVGEMTTLQSFSLTDNGLIGTLPTELGKLTDMTQMWFFLNKITGTIPTELGELSRLNRLEIEANDLIGVMPTEICENVQPRGLLENLEADCDIACACCSCCGVTCIHGYNGE